jgi:hypothetical protein
MCVVDTNVFAAYDLEYKRKALLNFLHSIKPSSRQGVSTFRLCSWGRGESLAGFS